MMTKVIQTNQANIPFHRHNDIAFEFVNSIICSQHIFMILITLWIIPFAREYWHVWKLGNNVHSYSLLLIND